MADNRMEEDEETPTGDLGGQMTPTPTTGRTTTRWDQVTDGDAAGGDTPGSQMATKWDPTPTPHDRTAGANTPTPSTQRGSRWDRVTEADAPTPTPRSQPSARQTRWDEAGDATPTPTTGRPVDGDALAGGDTPGSQQATKWGNTPTPHDQAAGANTPTPSTQRGSRWDRVTEADAPTPTPMSQPSARRTRWDEAGDGTPTPATNLDDGGATPTPSGRTPGTGSRWDRVSEADAPTPTPTGARARRWDEEATPVTEGSAKRTRWDEAGDGTPTPATVGDDGGVTPTPTTGRSGTRWDRVTDAPTPTPASGSRWTDDVTPVSQGSAKRTRWDDGAGDATPTPSTAQRKTRWDDGGDATPTPSTARKRWDETGDGEATPTPLSANRQRWDDQGDATPTPAKRNRWDEAGEATPTPSTRRNRWDEAGEATPTPMSTKRRWDERGEATPTPGTRSTRWDPGEGATPKRSRWDETPRPTPGGGAQPTPTPGVGPTPTGTPGPTPGTGQFAGTPGVAFTPTPGGLGQFAGAPGMQFGQTPAGMQFGATPAMGMAGVPFGAAMQTPATPLRPEDINILRVSKEIDDRNRPLSDEELDDLFPKDGYKVLDPPEGYAPIRTPIRKYTSTPTPYDGGFVMEDTPQPGESSEDKVDIKSLGPNLPDLKPADYQFFSPLLSPKEEDEMSPEELRDTKIMKLLLKVKNGNPQQRKGALRQLTDKAREFGAGPLFDQILPLLMSPTLEDQERHLLVKVIDRILYKLDDMVRPYVHKILVVIEPLLIDEDYYARVEGREIISNLSKAAGLATMIATMRPDIDNVDEYVRNTTARAFAVVASALGIPSLIPFLGAVCQCRKSWQARHTGIKIVQQIAILMGCAVLPHLKQLVLHIHHGLTDEQQKVRTITALALAALAEAAAPYGIESFDCVLEPLWQGIEKHKSKGLAAFLKAIGYIIPLMDAEYANYYTQAVMGILIREFKTPDEEMKKIVLKVVKQCVATEGVEKGYVETEVLPPFFKTFWANRRMALDRRNYRQLVDTTVEIANKVGATQILEKIVEDLKDESEPYRRMVMETIEKVVENLGVDEVEARLEEQLIDGLLYAFQEQTSDDNQVMLAGFGMVINALKTRVKPYLAQIGGTIQWRLNNKDPKVRQQAADLVARVASVIKDCDEEQLLSHMGLVLYEYLGEEYPDVLGSILGALKAVVNVIGMSKMTPPIKDLLPRLTPVLKNRQEKVQENCIDLVGRIADRGAEYVPAREWMRICFELLELLKAHKKAIRRAAVSTFGYIAKAIGPSDVLSTLLSNLKVQERQLRVCTTVAIAIVAETCSPFTVLPGLMNEYRVPELNVQNGVLKALSFLFEYIGEMGKDYIYAVTPLLEDALMDRDLVHRQIACNAVKHMSLGVQCLGCEDALRHLLNFVWPNIFETSPHVINAVFEAMEGLRVSLGCGIVLQYTLQGLFHPARKVREVYWKVYNNIYIGGQDAVVAFTPQLENDSTNRYHRDEMDYFL